MLGGIDETEPFQTAQAFFQVRDLLGRDGELPGGKVLCQHRPVTVVDQPSRRWQRLDPEPITLRELREDLVLHDLQLEQPPYQHAREEQDDYAGGDEPRQEEPLLLPVILQWNRGVHAQTRA